MSLDDFRKYYEREFNQFERLRTAVVGILQSAIAAQKIDTLTVQSRIKSLESALEKCQTKSYQSPAGELTDLVGFRIICYIESDVDEVSALLRSLFDIDEANSSDKRNPANSRELGYRSLHLICTLGTGRAKLTEYSDLTAIRFEIQVRSVLQHAWAEIEHKRNYKGKLALPGDLERRLMIASGALELIDREFSEIAKSSARYVESIRVDQAFLEDAISGLALIGLYSKFLAANGFADVKPEFKFDSSPAKIVDELRLFGISTVREAQSFLNSDLSKKILERYRAVNDTDSLKFVVGFYRYVMMATDVEKYFNQAFNGGFKVFSKNSPKLLEPFVSNDKLIALAKKHGVDMQ